MQLLNLIREHWFDVLQTAGIVGGLFFTGISLRTDAKAKRLQSLFTITKHHREIWSEFYERPELSRILDPKADLATKPVTNEERLFVNFLIFHLNNSYQAINDGLYRQPEGLKKDIASFFTLPIPKAVWATARDSQDRKFAAFVEKAF